MGARRGSVSIAAGPLRRRPAAARLAALAVVVLALAGCQVRTTMRIEVEDDGSGVVTVELDLDREAATRVPDLAQTLAVDDLRRTGWSITGPRQRAGGAVRVVARRPFAGPSQFASVMTQLTGPGGAVQGFRLQRRHRFGSTSYELRGTVDLARGLDTFAEAELTELLGGNPFGRPPAELDFIAGGPVREHLHLALKVRLPGGGTGNAPQVSDGGEGVWAPQLGDQPVTVEATSTRRSSQARVWAGLAVVSVVLAVVTLIWILRVRRLERPPSYVHVPGGPRRPWETEP